MKLWSKVLLIDNSAVGLSLYHSQWILMLPYNYNITYNFDSANSLFAASPHFLHYPDMQRIN